MVKQIGKSEGLAESTAVRKKNKPQFAAYTIKFKNFNYFLGSMRGKLLRCPKQSCNDWGEEAAKVLISHLVTKKSGKWLFGYLLGEGTKELILSGLNEEISMAAKLGDALIHEKLDKIKRRFEKGAEKVYSLGWKDIGVFPKYFPYKSRDGCYGKVDGEAWVVFYSPHSIPIKEIKKEVKSGGGPFSIYVPPIVLDQKLRQLPDEGIVRPFKLVIRGTVYELGEVTTYEDWGKTIAGPYITFFGDKERKTAKVQISSPLLILQPPPYRVGQTIEAEFSIKNSGTAPITFSVLTVGGRLNGKCPQDMCPDFTWKYNIILQPGKNYLYKGKLKLKAPGNYHFFTAYRTKEGWNTAIPTASGVKNTIDVVVRHSAEEPVIKKWKRYKLGDLFFSVPSNWHVMEKNNSFVGGPNKNYTDRRYISCMISVTDKPKFMEHGKSIVHFGSSGGEIEERGATYKTFSITHMGRLLDSFKVEIAGRPVTVCVLRLTKNEGIPVKGMEFTNLSFALIDGGKYYAFNLIASDPVFQKAMFRQLVSRIHLSSKVNNYSNGAAWPMFRYNAQHTAQCPYDTSKNNGTLKWKYKTGDDVESSPAIAQNGTVYVGSFDHCLYALNPDGSLKWKYKTGGAVPSSPAIAQDGTVYVGSADNYLYALNPDGTLKWKYKTGGYVGSSPAIAQDGTVYVGSNHFGPADGYLYALNPDGTLKWKYGTGNYVETSPAIASDGTVYVGSSNDWYLYALNPDGTLKWKYKTGWYVDTSPAIAQDGTVYVGSDDGYLYALNPDGTLKWKYKTGRGITSSPAIAQDGTVYFGSGDYYLYAIGSK